MHRSARAASLVAALAISATSFATCRVDDAPPPPRPDTVAPIKAPRATRAPRKRATRAAVPAPAADAAALGDRSIDVGDFPPAPADTPRPPSTGRVRVLMLKDGRPFEGGHVCFCPADKYVEAKAWDGTRCSDGAYFGVPLYTALWPNFDPVLGSADGEQSFEERARGVTGADGVVTLDVRANTSLVPYVRFAMSGIPLVSQPRVNVAEGGDATLTIEAAPMRTLTGRCVDFASRPLAGMWVQAVAPGEERPLSRNVETSVTGAFQLEVWGKDPDVRVRAVVPYHARPLGIYDAESEVPPIPAETTIAGVVPGAGPVDVRVPPAPVVFIELTVAAGEPALAHVQIEGLAFDPRASAWGRLGGPQYRRVTAKSAGLRAVIALPSADAARPLMLWSWGRTITAVDPRGAGRVCVEIPRGRRASVRGRGWKDGDRLRVVCFLGPEGQEFPCIWIDGVIGNVDNWCRDDAPVSAIEFQIVRDGAVVGRSARVPPGVGPATEVRVDLD